MSHSFLPDGYAVPKSGGNYMKLRGGANKFRILSAPILGFEYWTDQRKPVRARKLWDVIPVDADISNGWNPKHFWAFVVWNFDEKAIQILEITQSTIQRALTDLIHNEEWGDPRNYTITVNRKGEKLETEYSVVPSPAKPVPQDIMDAYQDKKIDLTLLFDGGDPFNAEARNADTDREDFPTNTKQQGETPNPDDVPF
jgi:hypothetical protein